MKPIDEQVIIVTGSTDGIGKRTAHDLASMGARVLLHGRSEEKGREAREELERSTGSRKLEYYNGDFSSLREVRRLADEVAADHPRLDVLINNAGIGMGKRTAAHREVSADGYELRFQVNYLAPFLLTRLLLPCLRRAAPSRIVNVSSLGQADIDFDDVMLERRYSPTRAYGQSKLALAMFTIDLAEELRDQGITVNALHPGSLLNTKIVREWYGLPWGSVQQGADAEVFLATSAEVEGVTGEFFDRMKPDRARPQAYDPEARRRLRQLSEELTGIREAVRA